MPSFFVFKMDVIGVNISNNHWFFYNLNLATELEDRISETPLSHDTFKQNDPWKRPQTRRHKDREGDKETKTLCTWEEHL